MIVALDVIAGASILAVGILEWRRFRRSAAFAIAAAVTWFVVPALPFLVFLHRPLLLHSILALPRRRVPGRLPRVLLVVAWIGAVLPPAGQAWVSGTTAALCVAVAMRFRTSERRVRSEEVAARDALLLLAAALVLPVLERLVWPMYVEAGLPLATYLCAVALCCAAIVRGLLTPSRQEPDAIIELSDRTPVAALVELKRWIGAESDPGRSRSLRSAIALLEDNARLQRDLVARIDEVRASRARLVSAAIDERQRLERILGDGALRYLGELEACLASTSGDAHRDPMVATCLQEVTHTREDLEQLARGLHPRILVERGLAAALEGLGGRSPVPVVVCAPEGRFPERIETTVWYACAEALANVWKHARATGATVEVTESRGVLQACICDDGVGGARLSPGGGLTGLMDRLSAVDGQLALATSRDGTEVTIVVPLP